MSEPIIFDLDSLEGKLAFAYLMHRRVDDPLYRAGWMGSTDPSLRGMKVRVDGDRIAFSPRAAANFAEHAGHRPGEGTGALLGSN